MQVATGKWIDSGEAMEKGIMCMLHGNPDKQKYFCLCQGEITKQELSRYYKMQEDKYDKDQNKLS